MKEVEGILYLCHGNQPMRPIHRIDHDEHGCTREVKGTLPTEIVCLAAVYGYLCRYIHNYDQLSLK
jgi:hypothetical protein